MMGKKKSVPMKRGGGMLEMKRGGKVMKGKKRG